ncbi:MAG TPA: hypothetical protein VH000_02365, partial [Rhizomicrobium sp.]|nr:hypothetical protein [Rhizomicrobium sp.]
KVRNFEGMGGISSALGRRNDNSCISAHADYRREDFVFSRTQSLAMRASKWESREKPVKHWGANFVANLAWEIFA